jgi:outer membrane PBP1 activator LpoA protein
MQASLPARLTALTLWLLLLAGCAQIGDRARAPAPLDPDLARAAALLEAGQPLAAAELYRQVAARTADTAQRTDHLLAAGEASRAGGDWDGVRWAVERLADTAPSGERLLRLQLLRAAVALQERNPDEAIAALAQAPAADSPPALRIRFHQERAAAYRQLGNLLETAHELQAVDALLTDPLQRLETQTDILRTLALLNEQALVGLQPSPPGIRGGWMELALLVKRNGTDPARLQPLMAEWRERFPQHPALPELLDSYRQRLESQWQELSRIAILLPQSGQLAAVAAAIRDGILTSRFAQDPAARPELRFYDAGDASAIWPLYNRAVEEGAQLVIGPLQKEAVAQLLRAGELPVPVLALNQVEIETIPPDNLFMFSLSPEDEAQQAAERIWLDGGRRPLLLVPASPWGERMADAFTRRWADLGGSVAGLARYDDNGHDHSAAITALLHIDRSIARHRQLEGWLGRRLEFEPSRRDDADAVFVAANPVQMQGIRPQLAFHRGGDLPVYSTSHAWSGQLSASQAEDMRGILLADIPWLVAPDPAISASLPDSVGGLGRLFAMGMDALRLAPQLRRLQSSRFESLDGSTGNLYMDEFNQVRRQLVWLRLDSQPQVLGYAPRLDLQADDGRPAPGSGGTAGEGPAS